MLKKWTSLFICFGLSFLVESLGWAEQGKAFLLISLGATGLILAYLTLSYISKSNNSPRRRITFLEITAIFYVIFIAISLFATWGFAKLFNADFHVTYQIMAFILCLIPNRLIDRLLSHIKKQEGTLE